MLYGGGCVKMVRLRQNLRMIEVINPGNSGAIRLDHAARSLGYFKKNVCYYPDHDDKDGASQPG